MSCRFSDWFGIQDYDACLVEYSNRDERGSCGDGFCADAETNVTCPADCANFCDNDNICEMGENPRRCGDCGGVGSGSPTDGDTNFAVYLYDIEDSELTTRTVNYDVYYGYSGSSVDSCDLYLDGSVVDSDSSISLMPSHNVVGLSGLTQGIHMVYVSCFDSNGKISNSSLDSFVVENPQIQNCVIDGVCNDSVLGGRENEVNCPADCTPTGVCNNNNVCENTIGEFLMNCEHDCHVCGDGKCSVFFGETRDNCGLDCASCSSTGLTAVSGMFINGVNDQVVSAVTVDGLGNLYATGYSNNFVDFGNGVNFSVSFFDGFLAKYNSSGSVLWARRIYGANSNEHPRDVAVDSAGNLYVFGTFRSNFVDFGNGINLSNNDLTVPKMNFLAKYNSEGLAQWVVRLIPDAFTGLGDEVDAYGLEVVSGDNILVSGRFKGTSLVVGSIDASSSINLIKEGSSSSFAGFLAKYDSNGNAIWAQAQKGIGNTFTVNSYSTTEDYSDGVYLTGVFSGGPLSVGSGVTIAYPGCESAFITKYNSSNGSAIWGKAVASCTDMNNRFAFNSIDVDLDNNLYVSGIASKFGYGSDPLLDFGNGVSFMVRQNVYNSFLVSYSSDGIARWVSVLNSTLSDTTNPAYLHGVLVENEKLYAVGAIYSSRSFDLGNGVSLISPTGIILAPFVVKYSLNGVAEFARVLSNSLSNQDLKDTILLNSIAIDSFSGKIYLGSGIKLPSNALSPGLNLENGVVFPAETEGQSNGIIVGFEEGC